MRLIPGKLYMTRQGHIVVIEKTPSFFEESKVYPYTATEIFHEGQYSVTAGGKRFSSSEGGTPDTCGDIIRRITPGEAKTVAHEVKIMMEKMYRIFTKISFT